MRRPRRALSACLAGLAAGVLVMAGSAAAGSPRDPGPGSTTAPDISLPEAGVDWDYQIGGAFSPAASVGIVARDRRAAPSAGDYNVCYVNAFQTQPDETAFWRRDRARWSLVLKDAGRPVVDGAWGEFLLDTRTAAKRSALADIVGRWIDGCAESGFDAVELDNLDSFYRGRRLITRADNRAFARMLTARAHAAGLAVGQKNWAEISARGPGLGFDFAIAEQCGQFAECGRYAAAYDDRVLVVEYRNRPFARTCRRWGDRLSVVRRDVDVTPDGVNRRC